jgi:hypothetical protein
MATITTDQELDDEVGKLAGAGVPAATATLQQAGDTTTGEIQDSTTGIKVAAPATTPVAAQVPIPTPGLPGIPPPIGSTPQPTVPAKPATGVGQVAGTTTVAGQIGTATAAQITQPVQVDMTGVQGTVSAGSIGTAATQQLDQQATTQYQLGQLMQSIQQGQPLPPWAAPAVRKISGVMQARGLGASSMAAAAMTQAVMESGVVIASQDANKYATIQLANLNNEQQMALQNAATYAAMDKGNLNARLTAAVTNAQSLLATETKNLEARQSANTLSFNALTQAMFKDAAEDNARKQFNAKNELQVEEFFAELGSQVETANANRVAAMEQFNAGEKNAMTQFNASMRDARDKFNANMQYAVDQSNVNWRRQVNTANTATQNEANRINVQNSFNATQNALNNLWQKYRDNAAWNFQKGESELQRQHEVGIMAMEFANTEKLYDKKQKDDLAAGVGNWLAKWIATGQ